MGAAGFSDVRIDTATRVIELASKQEFWELMRGSAPPARVLFSHIGESNVEAVKSALFDILAERFGDGPVHLQAEATIGVGTAK